MAISETSIANMALARIGAERISDLETDDSLSAIHCRVHYEQARDSMLRSHAWAFAAGRSELNEDATEPDFQWAHQYVLPADCLRVVGLYDSYSSYSVEGRRLLTDESAANLIYIKGITDPTKFDQLFVDALVLELAKRIVMPLSQDKVLRREIADELREVLSRARVVNAQESNTLHVNDAGTWNVARSGDDVDPAKLG
jgi:hypothetical protein